MVVDGKESLAASSDLAQMAGRFVQAQVQLRAYRRCQNAPARVLPCAQRPQLNGNASARGKTHAFCARGTDELLQAQLHDRISNRPV